MIIDFLFYFFKFLLCFSTLMVVSVRNPVHSVLFLILVFCNSSALLLLLGAEFLSIILIVVYVGAIAVLFLFVIMMLDLRGLDLRRGYLAYFPTSIFLVFSFAILFTAAGYSFFYQLFPIFSIEGEDFLYDFSNIQVLGAVLYTYYFVYFLFSAVILLIAMVGAISLTHTRRSNSVKQDIFLQISRTSEIWFRSA